METLSFTFASEDGHFRDVNGSIAPTAAYAKTVTIHPNEVSGVIICHATSHSVENSKVLEWRHTRGIVTKDGEIHIIALASGTKDGRPAAIKSLDETYLHIDKSALDRVAAMRDARKSMKAPGDAPNPHIVPA